MCCRKASAVTWNMQISEITWPFNQKQWHPNCFSWSHWFINIENQNAFSRVSTSFKNVASLNRVYNRGTWWPCICIYVFCYIKELCEQPRLLQRLVGNHQGHPLERAHFGLPLRASVPSSIIVTYRIFGFVIQTIQWSWCKVLFIVWTQVQMHAKHLNIL